VERIISSESFRKSIQGRVLSCHIDDVGSKLKGKKDPTSVSASGVVPAPMVDTLIVLVHLMSGLVDVIDLAAAIASVKKNNF